jgi:hypothetical protein
MTTTDNSRADAPYILLEVRGLQDLDTALDRADSKGHLPDDIRSTWESLDWRTPVEQHEAAPAPLKLAHYDAFDDAEKAVQKDVKVLRELLGRPAPSAPLEGTGNGADERAAFPRYTEWMHLRKHGEWSNGVPDWARDHTGRMNDFTAASAVIEELASRAAASQPAAGQNTVLIDANIDLGRAVAACTQEVFLDASQPAAAAGQEVVAIVTETHEAREKPDLYTIKAKARLNIGDRLYTAPLAQVATRQEFCAKDISDLRAGIDYAEAMGYLKQERAEQLRALLEGAKQ